MVKNSDTNYRVKLSKFAYYTLDFPKPGNLRPIECVSEPNSPCSWRFILFFWKLFEKMFFCSPCVAKVFATCLRIRGNKNRRPGGKTLLRLWSSNGVWFSHHRMRITVYCPDHERKKQSDIGDQKKRRYVIFSQKSLVIRASAIDIHSRVRARTDSPGFGRGVDMGVNGYESLMAPPFYMILKSEIHDVEITNISDNLLSWIFSWL